jgi:hypothetical protein
VTPAISRDVYHSDEFKAFCKRFGIVWGLPTTKLTIVLDNKEVMKVTQEYNARNIVDGSIVINTTTVHNEMFHTATPDSGKDLSDASR